MYSKQRSSVLKQQFWTAFGHYMSPVPSAQGEKINWINYKTGIKHLHFRMNAENRQARVAIESSHPDPESQEIFFKKFSQHHSLLYDCTQEEWQWKLHDQDASGKLVSLVFTELGNVSVFNQEDWPVLISFFKKRMTGLDAFWSSAKFAFEGF